MRKKNSQMSGLTAVLAVLATVALVLAAQIGLFTLTGDQVKWPEFPAAEKTAPPSAPSVVAQLERDFAYRIGDVVPVVLYIKEAPDTRVDLNSIALEGDFEIRGNGKLYQETTKEGGRILRFQLSLQSFSAAPSVSTKAAVSYRVLSTNEEYTVSLPALAVSTSNTWDQKDRIVEGALIVLHGWHGWINGGLLVCGLLLSIYGYRRYRYYKSLSPEALNAPRRAKRFVVARIRFDRVWNKIEAGDLSAANYIEIERIVRALYEIESKTTREAGFWFLYGNRGPYQAVDILHQCDRVIYLGETLSVEDNQLIKTTFDKLVPHYSPEDLAVAAEILASPSERRRMREANPGSFQGRRLQREDDQTQD